MIVDVDKQIYSWWVTSDTDLSCVCGYSIQLDLEDCESKVVYCPDCSQKWRYQLKVEKIDE